MPLPRRVPVVPRPRKGELSGSYLGRLAHANRTELRTFVRLLSQAPVQLPADEQDLSVMLLTLNDAAFARLLTYTGHLADRLTRAIPSLTPRTFKVPGEPPAIRISFLQESTIDCPGCRRRRGGAHLDTRLFPHKMACLRHGYWLYGQGRGQPLDFALIPEVAAAQRRFDRLVSRGGSPTATRAYRIADSYLNSSWRTHYHPWWYPAMVARWQQRAESGDSPPATRIWRFPGWAMHPECTALAAVFASSYWTRLAVPAPDRRHRLFYQRLLAELSVDSGRPLRTIRDFAPLPGDIQEQARWGRVLSDPEWGTPAPLFATPRRIPFIDITDNYEASAACWSTK